MNILNELLIKNDYYIIDNPFNDEFLITIYYKDPNKCKIIIRRLDDIIGWGQDLKIKIMNNTNYKYEKISLGSSYENSKIIEYYTNILLVEENNDIKSEQIIPKIIIQVSNENMNKNLFHYNSIMSFIELNPEYQYKYFNDNDCRDFIQKYDNNINDENIFNIDFTKENILKAYDLLIPMSLKADLFKYYYLYVIGGCYFDCKVILNIPLSKIINNDDKVILCSENNFFYDGLICIEPKNELIYNCLKETVNNIINRNKCTNPYLTCGKELFYKHFNNSYGIKLEKKNDYINFINNGNNRNNGNNKYVLKSFYKKYYDNYYNTEKDRHYMWVKNLYFYIDLDFIKNDFIEMIFYIYPNIIDDKFKIYYEKNDIFKIKRIDKNEGWGASVKLKIIDILRNNIYYIDVGHSYENEKYFIIK